MPTNNTDQNHSQSGNANRPSDHSERTSADQQKQSEAERARKNLREIGKQAEG
jgi:hypothetical protein